MAHSVYTGSFAALEKRWIETVVTLRRTDPMGEINVLVGSNILASYLKRCFVKSGEALANVRFYTFLDLVNRLAGETGTVSSKPRIPDLGTSVLLENILSTETPEIFSPLSKFDGFRESLLDTFRDLRDAGTLPERLEQAIRSLEIKGRERHLSALAGLYRRYRESVGAFRDVDDDFRIAISGCSRAVKNLGMRQLMVYGVYDVTGQQARLLASLKNSVEMTCFIPYVNGAVSGFAQPFLDAVSRDLESKPEKLTEPGAVSELDRLSARDFGLALSLNSSSPEALQPDGSFSLVSVPGESRLAVEIVREIVRAHRDGTITGFHEAAVVLRQPEADVPVLAEMFRLRGIPYYVHGGISFAGRLCAKAAVAVLDLTANSFSRESILTAMELVAASLPDADAGCWDVPSWRALTNASRFLAGIRSWDAGIDGLVNRAKRNLQNTGGGTAGMKEGEDLPAGVSSREALERRLQETESLRKAWRLLRAAAADWPGYLSWRGWAELLFQRLEPLLGRSGDWFLLSAVLEKMTNLDALGDRPVPQEALRTSLLHSVRSLDCPVGQFQKSGVNILSTGAARGLRFPLVILPGLEEGRFPARLRQDPLLLDAERRRLENLPLKKKRLEEERLLFDMAARSAMKRLVLMTSRLDESSDRERIPSQFFLRSAAAVCGDVVALRELTPESVPGFRSVSLDNPAPPADEIIVDEGEVRLRLVVSGPYARQIAVSALARLEPQRFDGPVSYDRARWQRGLTPYDGCFHDPSLVQRMAATLPSGRGQVSASRLEAYAKCPYYYFLKYGMELEAWEEAAPAEAIDPLERGLAVHTVLERFLKEREMRNVFETPEQELWSFMEPLARNIIGEYRPVGIADLIWEIETESLLGMLHNWIVFETKRAGDGLNPSRFELVFGEFSDEASFPAFRVETGRHSFDFRGRIDRVDVSPDGQRARVVDYKTGALPQSMASKSRTPLMGGERIQLAVYRGALSVLDAYRSVQSVEGEYLHLQPRDARILASSFSDCELEQASGQLGGVLDILGDGIGSGLFFARTSGMLRPSGHCDYCEYLTICGKDRVQREERKADDPRVRNFMKITEYP